MVGRYQQNPSHIKGIIQGETFSIQPILNHGRKNMFIGARKKEQ